MFVLDVCSGECVHVVDTDTPPIVASLLAEPLPASGSAGSELVAFANQQFLPPSTDGIKPFFASSLCGYLPSAFRSTFHFFESFSG